MSTMKLLSCKAAAVTVSFIMLFSVLVSFPFKASAERTYDCEARAEKLACYINELRVEAGLQPLKIVPYLCEASEIRANECVGKFSHERPEYVEYGDGIRSNGYETVIDENIVPWLYIGENIAVGKSSPVLTLKQWEDSPTHWKIIMNPEYTHMGVAMVYVENDPNPENYRFYWEAIFVGCGVEFEDEYIPEMITDTPTIYGDVNCDGVVNTFDIIALEKFLVEEKELNRYQFGNADVYHDGNLTMADVVVLRKYILGERHDLPMLLGEEES